MAYALNAMFKHHIHTVSKRSSIDWFLLAFLAGNVNTGGYLACQRFVTHVTGFSTLSGIEFAKGRWDGAIGILSVPLFFLLGVMISAYHIDRRHHRGLRPRYAMVMGLVAICLLAATFAGYFGFFGTFGEVSHLKNDYFLLALLCTASGLQNAAISTASGATIRTTHLTGVTTDLGIGIVRSYFTYEGETAEHHRQEIRANYLRVGTIFSFMVGSAVGATLFVRYQYLGFLLPMSVACYAMVVAHFTTTTKIEEKPNRSAALSLVK